MKKILGVFALLLFAVGFVGMANADIVTAQVHETAVPVTTSFIPTSTILGYYADDATVVKAGTQFKDDKAIIIARDIKLAKEICKWSQKGKAWNVRTNSNVPFPTEQNFYTEDIEVSDGEVTIRGLNMSIHDERLNTLNLAITNSDVDIAQTRDLFAK